jgi:4a-hydroxytetrahydrobiopterin dehydratase
LSPERTRQLLAEVPGWSIDQASGELWQEFEFDDYAQTVTFANGVANLAERQEHHPVLVISWGRCVVRYSTHTVGGLSENDFICAAKINAIAEILG